MSPVTSLLWAVAFLACELALQVSGYQSAALAWMFGAAAIAAGAGAIWGLLRDGWFPFLRARVSGLMGAKSDQEPDETGREEPRGTSRRAAAFGVMLAVLLAFTASRVIGCYHSRVMFQATTAEEFLIAPATMWKDGQDRPPFEKTAAWGKYKNLRVGWVLPLAGVSPMPTGEGNLTFVSFKSGSWVSPFLSVGVIVDAGKVPGLKSAPEGTPVEIHGTVENINELGVRLGQATLTVRE